MPFPKCKVYFDGSHYIAIPHTEKRYRPRPKKREEVFIVKDGNVSELPVESTEVISKANSTPQNGDVLSPLEKIADTGIREEPEQSANLLQPNERLMTKKELFNELYQQYLYLKKSERREKLIASLRPYFKTVNAVKNYVDSNIERKRRNLIMRRIRLTRKVNLQTFTHFVTFTFNGQLHTEEIFRKGLKKTLANFASRKGWKYVGVWERSPEKQRLHFHGLFYIPEGTMPGLLLEKSDYSFKSRRRQITVQNTYFNERFGRSDFEKIEDYTMLGNSVAYLMKYLEKTGEKIVYSKGLPQYFISDVMDDDVVTTIGLEDRKLLLFDDFECWDEGVSVGKVNGDTIAQLRKSN